MATPSSAASRRVRSAPESATGASSTVPSSAVTSSTKLGEPSWNCSASTSSALANSERGVVEPAGRQALGDAAAEGAGEDEEDDRTDEDESSAPDGEVGEAGEHRAYLRMGNVDNLSTLWELPDGVPVQMTSVTAGS